MASRLKEYRQKISDEVDGCTTDELRVKVAALSECDDAKNLKNFYTDNKKNLSKTPVLEKLIELIDIDLVKKGF